MSDILLTAFLLSAVLLGIHSYFGLEIIRRGIIFTDLAIGQMAALGAAVSLFFMHGEYLYPTSLAASLMGGLLIAFAQRRSEHLEAFIGLMYAFGISAVFIILSRSHHGMETFQSLMAADILFTPLHQVLNTALLYTALGAAILFMHKKTSGLIREVLFFVTFAVTVTSSVKLAGVLIVFALLVAPALIAITIGRRNPLVWAWIIGTVLNIVSIMFSYVFDFPTGYTIVFINALAALAVSLLFRREPDADKTADA